MPRPWSLDAHGPLTSDGTYRIVFAGADAAGNEASTAEVTFESAVDGPELELSRPAPRIPWGRGESGGFEIQIIARDPNGVGGVRGAVRRGGASDVPFELRSTGDSKHASVSVWTGTVGFDESWANSPIEVRLSAEDAFGTPSEKAESRELGPIDRIVPLRVAVDFDGIPVEELHLVEGNVGGPYTFGGRVDAEEERAFSALGLPPFNSLNTPRAWRVIYESHEIPSFYLDEHEVSVEQFLAFVRAEGGFRSPAHWPAGTAPDAARAENLERELAAGRKDLPVAEVTWEEATAYAHWVGKRLPSLVEWEFAVRGGALYRPFAGARPRARTVQHAPTREEVDYDPDVAGDGSLRPCVQKGDVTEDTGIFDLCGNVSEWTATPASFLEGAVTPLNLPAHVLENRAPFLDPRRTENAEKSERYWVAGGSFQTARADFSVVDRRGRTWHGPAVGFRCAADVDSATAVPASAPAGRPRFRESFE
jgi:formylglycine-generating enzyme required for sulfatase activity